MPVSSGITVSKGRSWLPMVGFPVLSGIVFLCLLIQHRNGLTVLVDLNHSLTMFLGSSSWAFGKGDIVVAKPTVSA